MSSMAIVAMAIVMMAICPPRLKENSSGRKGGAIGMSFMQLYGGRPGSGPSANMGNRGAIRVELVC